jgi:hypothetical protein
LAPASFRAARTGSSTTSAAPRRGIGMRVVYALDVAARVRITVQRAVAGRRAGARCVAPGKANRAGKRCTRFARVSGSFARTRPAGRDRFTFTGRLAARRLAPGRYRLVATPSASGRTGKLAHVSMRIVR